MSAIQLNDLEMNEELDNKALENILGGKWVKRTYIRRIVRRYTRRYTRRYRIVRYIYRTYYRTYTRVTYQRYTKWVWV